MQCPLRHLPPASSAAVAPNGDASVRIGRSSSNPGSLSDEKRDRRNSGENASNASSNISKVVRRSVFAFPLGSLGIYRIYSFKTPKYPKCNRAARVHGTTLVPLNESWDAHSQKTGRNNTKQQTCSKKSTKSTKTNTLKSTLSPVGNPGFRAVPARSQVEHQTQRWKLVLGKAKTKHESIWIKYWNILKYIEIYWNILKYIEIYWNILKYIEIYWNILKTIHLEDMQKQIERISQESHHRVFDTLLLCIGLDLNLDVFLPVLPKWHLHASPSTSHALLGAVWTSASSSHHNLAAMKLSSCQ